MAQQGASYEHHTIWIWKMRKYQNFYNWTRNGFVKHYAPNYMLVDTKCQSWKSNPKFTKIYSGHLHIGSKQLAKFHEPNSSDSLDILLTRFSFAQVWKGA